MSSPSKRREMDLMKLMMSDYKVETINDGMQEFYVQFHGPKESPYNGGVWKIRVELPDDYPYKSPSIGFVNKIYHPNVEVMSGSVCLDVINQAWSPMFGKKPSSDELFQRTSGVNMVTIDVGGQLFQTTKQTLTSAGSKSFFAKIASFDESIHFIDRDPELFSVMLSLLRTGNLSSKAKVFDIQDLIFESKYYGIEHLLINSQSNPSQFEAFNLEKSTVLSLNGRDSPSAISTTKYGSVHVAHGSKITSFDWSLQRKSTILTQFTGIDSLLAVSPKIVAAGATDFSGLQIINLEKGFVRETLDWENVTKSSSTVQGIGSSNEYLFTSFESGRRNSNCIMVYDLRDDFRPVTMIGHNEIFGADLYSAIPATKLSWIPSHNLLMASGSHSGPSGVVGNIKFWDIRSGNVVWEIKEKVDCFADVTVSDNLSGIFKVGVNSGEVFFTDFKNIGTKPSWVCLGDERKVLNGKKEGIGAKIESHGNQVFRSKGGDIELWSEVHLGSSLKNSKNGLQDRMFRNNLMGRAKEICGSRITNMDFGGNKMFVSRKDQQYVEVWQSSSRGF